MVAFEDIEREIRALAKEYPDVVYQAPDDGGCSYVRGEGGPGEGCIFGQVLRRLGVVDEFGFADFEGESIARMLQVISVQHTPDQAAWANRVQANQDSGRPWARAVSLADSFPRA